MRVGRGLRILPIIMQTDVVEIAPPAPDAREAGGFVSKNRRIIKAGSYPCLYDTDKRPPNVERK